MLCSKCGKNDASVHVFEERNGNRKEYYLCGECAQEALTENENGIFQPESILENLFSMSFAGSSLMENFFGNKMSGYGCAEASKGIKEEIPVLHLKNGKVVEEDGVNRNKESMTDIEKLKEEMTLAVKNEEYEKAAQLRDKIEKMEKQE